MIYNTYKFLITYSCTYLFVKIIGHFLSLQIDNGGISYDYSCFLSLIIEKIMELVQYSIYNRVKLFRVCGSALSL